MTYTILIVDDDQKTVELILCWLLLQSSENKASLTHQLPDHVTSESHRKSREGEDSCSCSQNFLCLKASMDLAWSIKRRR